MKKMKIFNLHTQDTRDVVDLKVMAYEEYDGSGKMKSNRYVQFTILGNNDRMWTDFMPIKQFKKLNPKIKVAGLD